MITFNEFLDEISDDETDQFLTEFSLKTAAPGLSAAYLLSNLNQSSNVLKNLKFADDIEKKVDLLADQLLTLSRAMLAVAALVYFQTKKSQRR
jgi:hypothetical protein